MRTFIPFIVLAFVLVGFRNADPPEDTVQFAGECILPDDPEPPRYYRIDLVPTRNLPRLRLAEGYGDMQYHQQSPFGISIGKDGSYIYNLTVSFDNLPKFPGKQFVAWLTTPDLKEIRLLGSLDDASVNGLIDWNKFLVVISLEDEGRVTEKRWKGPIAYRGMSRSGLMHTMAGHGPFEQEPCAVYGYQ